MKILKFVFFLSFVARGIRMGGKGFDFGEANRWKASSVATSAGLFKPGPDDYMKSRRCLASSSSSFSRMHNVLY